MPLPTRDALAARDHHFGAHVGRRVIAAFVATIPLLYLVGRHRRALGPALLMPTVLLLWAGPLVLLWRPVQRAPAFGLTCPARGRALTDPSLRREALARGRCGACQAPVAADPLAVSGPSAAAGS